MVKLIGAIVILFAGTAIGFMQAARLAARPRQLREMIQALKRLETEIMYGFTPLPEAFRKLSEQCGEPIGMLFRSAADRLTSGGGCTTRQAWSEAVQLAWSRSAMKKQDYDIIVQIGFTLGITDRDNQMKHIALAAGQLQQEEAAAREEQSKYERMSRSLGFLFAAFVVILMY